MSIGGDCIEIIVKEGVWTDGELTGYKRASQILGFYEYDRLVDKGDGLVSMVEKARRDF